MPLPSASVVIPAYNCEKTIVHTLNALQTQTIPPKEVIVVDDGSSDQTAALIKTFPEVKYVFQDNQGPAQARNRGAEAASGEILFFTDADCIPELDWIEKALAPFENQQVAAVAGSYNIANSNDALARCIHREIIFRHERLMPLYPRSFGSYNVAIRRRVFTQVGGFNPRYRHASGEDNDLSYRILKSEYKIYFERNAKVKHFHTTHIGKYLREQNRHGYWRVRLYLDFPAMARGDDYTFWKDIIEIPLAFIMLLFMVLAPFFEECLWITFGLGFLTLSVQFIFSLMLGNNLSDSFMYAWVLWSRSFARAGGLSSGIIDFILKINGKKSK